MDNQTLNIINYAIIVDSIILIITILLQARGSGVGSLFGGGGGEYYRSRRGIEKSLYYGTIICAIILCTLCIAWALVAKSVLNS